MGKEDSSALSISYILPRSSQSFSARLTSGRERDSGKRHSYTRGRARDRVQVHNEPSFIFISSSMEKEKKLAGPKETQGNADTSGTTFAPAPLEG